MTTSSSAAEFTEKLLQVIRQQRHLATRIVIATQEPTVSPKLLDLCTMTIVHRFTSPEWFNALRSHLAGMSIIGDMISTESSAKLDMRKVFTEIVELEAGEALLFSPSAMIGAKIGGSYANADLKKQRGKPMLLGDAMPQKLGLDWVKIKVRKRLIADGGNDNISKRFLSRLFSS